MAPKSQLKHPQSHYSRNLAFRIIQQSIAVGGWDGMDMYSVPFPVSNLAQTFRIPAPEGKEGLERHGLNTSRLISVIVAWPGLTHKAEMLGEPVFGVAWCCQCHWMGQGRHPNLKMDMMIKWLFIKSSRKTWQIFLETTNNGHKMCEKTMCNMWSCVFPFCSVQNYHGNLEFSSWNIIKKSLKFFKTCLWEPCHWLWLFSDICW